MGKFVDLTGHRFGRLVAVERAENAYRRNGHPIVQWKCICDCGNYTVASASHLKSGDVSSCGCYYKERRKQIGGKVTHGLSRSRIYNVHKGMKQRCCNPNAPNYRLYGGRGISVCDDWLGPSGFDRFYEWAIQNGYSDSLTIDRIDPNGDYCPSNCRWANTEIQCNNTRKTVRLTHNGKTLSAAQWAKEYGEDRHRIYELIRAGKKTDEIFAWLDRRRDRAKISE